MAPATRVTRRRVAAAVLVPALGAQAVLYALLLQHPYPVHHTQWDTPQALVWATAPLWLVSAAALWVLRPTGRAAVLLVLGASAVLQAIAMTHAPTTSDDDYRYMWDAKVQLAGTDPYRYPPAAPQLAHLRDASLFGAPDHCRRAFPGGCTSINRPTVRTIYPPVAEAAFDGIRIASFGGRGGHLPLQLAAALGSLVVGLLLLRRAGPAAAALWAWSPLVVIDYANNAHIDWLAVLFVVAAMSARGIRTAGALVGAAIAVKLYPALVLPALLRRSWTAGVAAVGVVALSYVPHVLAVGGAVIGYLPGYLREEKYDSGDRLLLIGSVVPHPVDTVVAVGLVGLVALWAWWRGSLDAPARSAVVVVGVALLAFTPGYGWYAGILLALVALTGAVEWLPVVLAPMLAYVNHQGLNGLARPIWITATALTLAVALVRHRDSVRAWLRSTSPTTDRSRSSLSMPRR